MPGFLSTDFLSDAWIAAMALFSRAQFLHKDPEFEAVTEFGSELVGLIAHLS